jgi:putative oxidoreductase
MKYATIAARLLLALIFIVFSLNFWLNFIQMPPPPPADSPVGKFMGALFPTGYLAAVKVLELLGGILVASGRLTSVGLLILGPIILNILFVDVFLTKAFNPVSAFAAVLALFVLWTERARFAPLVRA